MNALAAPLVYWRAGGLLLLPLAAVCFGIWFYFLRLRRRVAIETIRADDELARLEVERDARASREREGFPYDRGEQDERLMEALRRDLGVLRALTVVAPLLGLLGTVVGMIATFQAVAGSGGDTAHRVAGGVSRALITTQVGLVVAIPGVFGQMNLRLLLSRLQVRLGALKLHFIEVNTERGS